MKKIIIILGYVFRWRNKRETICRVMGEAKHLKQNSANSLQTFHLEGAIR